LFWNRLLLLLLLLLYLRRQQQAQHLFDALQPAA